MPETAVLVLDGGDEYDLPLEVFRQPGDPLLQEYGEVSRRLEAAWQLRARLSTAAY